MPELTREEKLKLVEKLPQRLQDFLYSEDTGAFLLYLGNKYNLSDEKVSALSKIVADIILKITSLTSLAQEIANKVVPDSQAAMTIAQELNSELLSPVLTPAPTVSTAPPALAPVPKPVPSPTPSTPAPQLTPVPAPPAPMPAPTPATPRADQYRESINGAPEIVDLRKTPPSPAEAGYGGQRPAVAREGRLTPGLPISAAPIPFAPKSAPPLTFTKPVEPPKIAVPTPLIEAEPHKAVPSEPLPTRPQPQFIVRPPGLMPTDLPHNVLDLRKDKGEF